jgi:serine/threonine protein phosphatase PrpC
MNIGKNAAENQDTFVTSANPSGTKCFVGVFDGHGEKGRKISEFSRNMVTKVLFGHKDLHHDPRIALEAAYEETERQIERDYGQDAMYSGTTAVAAYQHRDKLFVANVGDSRAVLGCFATARESESGLKAVELSSDHKPGRPDERRRIAAEGGIVQQSSVPVQGVGGAVRLVRMGPERVMDKGGFGGLAVSRALGDLRLRPYVSSLPEVVERKLSHKDRLLILGSDGVWDRISSQEAVNIAAKHGDPNQAARMIANVARKRWQAETQGLLADDITAVVVNLDHTLGAASSGELPQQHQQQSQPSSPLLSPGVLSHGLRDRSKSEFDPMSPPPRQRHAAFAPPAPPRQQARSWRDAPRDRDDMGPFSPAAIHRPVTEGREALRGRLRRQTGPASSVGFERRPATVNEQTVPNHMLPPAGRRL